MGPRGEGIGSDPKNLVCMYQGLFNPRGELARKDREAVGVLTAQLMLPWSAWVHRRVERIEFTDEDTLARSMSMDFTIPHWFHARRGTPLGGVARQLVPLGLLRKGALVNFCLRDDTDRALPLLSTSQNRKVSEAIIVTLAREVLQVKVPKAIQCDIRRLIDAPPSDADSCIQQLYETQDKASGERSTLRDDALFRALADPLGTNFLALTMLEIGWQERKVIHYSYDELLWNEKRALDGLAVGISTSILVTVPGVGHADSFHSEIEAPEGLQIETRAGFSSYPGGPPLVPPIRKTGGFRRSHIHFGNVQPGAEAIVAVRLTPRPSTIVRSSCLAGLIGTIILGFLAYRYRHLFGGSEHGQTETAATVLLAIQGLFAVQLARSDENPMTTELLWGVRLIASIPGIAAFASAVTLVGDLDTSLGRTMVISFAVVSGLATSMLALWWRRLSKGNSDA